MDSTFPWPKIIKNKRIMIMILKNTVDAYSKFFANIQFV